MRRSSGSRAAPADASSTLSMACIRIGTTVSRPLRPAQPARQSALHAARRLPPVTQRVAAWYASARLWACWQGPSGVKSWAFMESEGAPARAQNWRQWPCIPGRGAMPGGGGEPAGRAVQLALQPARDAGAAEHVAARHQAVARHDELPADLAPRTQAGPASGPPAHAAWKMDHSLRAISATRGYAC